VPVEACQFLQWDTDFFGHRIARVNGSRLDAPFLESINQWSRENAIECLYFQADADDPRTIHLAEEYHFHLVEVRLTYERSLKEWNPETRPKAGEGISTRPAHPEDLPALLEIAQNSYVDSRYYFDERFSETQWQAYYRTWVKKSFTGGAELAIVAELNGQVVGYITGLVSKERPGEGQYELTGVRPEARRSGVGQELFRSGLDWYVQAGVGYVWLMTQGRNVPTQRMIQRDGFITRACHLYYHKWFNEA
jgi:GNAT superfamily N-acetyltransferase